MEILLQPRRSWKATHLVRMSAATWKYILTTDRRRADNIMNIAKSLWLSIPFPIVPSELPKGQWSSIARDGIYIDDADEVLQQMIKVPIDTITFNKWQPHWKTIYYIYLDDTRKPVDPMWHLVRSYDEFTSYILSLEDKSNLIISFDHDLEDSHYTPEHLWDDYEASKKYQEEQWHERTGYHCAQWLVEQWIVPDMFYVHSANPVWADNILHLLNNRYAENWSNKRWLKMETPFII